MSDEQQKAGVRVLAAAQIHAGRLSEYQAGLLVGSPDEIEEARQAVLAATEVWLDRMADQVWLQLSAMGIDPTKRHLT